MTVILKFNPLDQDAIEDRIRELIKEWDEDVFVFIKLLNKNDRAVYDELMDDVAFEIGKPEKISDVQDKAYEVRLFLDRKKDEYAYDIARNE